MFWDIPGSLTVFQSGSFLELKIAANSTYCEVNLSSYDRVVQGKKKNLLQGLQMFFSEIRKKTPFFPRIREMIADILGTGFVFRADDPVSTSPGNCVHAPENMVTIDYF